MKGERKENVEQRLPPPSESRPPRPEQRIKRPSPLRSLGFLCLDTATCYQLSSTNTRYHLRYLLVLSAALSTTRHPT